MLVMPAFAISTPSSFEIVPQADSGGTVENAVTAV